MNPKALQRLEHYRKEHGVTTKGKLSQLLVVTNRVRGWSFPLEFELLLSPKTGQIKGAGGAAVKRILEKHGIRRILSKEGGRTSRGSLDYVRKYVELLNDIHKRGWLGGSSEELSSCLEEIEQYWVSAVGEYFSHSPILVSVDLANSIGEIISSILDAVKERQKELHGEMILGTVLQHLVGAKLQLSLPEGSVEHHSASTSDDQHGRSGDFLIQDSVFHVTASPSEALISKCDENISAGQRPIVIVPFDKVATARGLADNLGIAERIEVFDVQSFISTNLNELAHFRIAELSVKTEEFVKTYNYLIEGHENNPSLHLLFRA